jgi:hypothetical protein
MAEIMVGEQVINKVGEMGKIISVNKDYIQVQFGDRVARFLHDAFEKGFLVYKNAELQNKIDELLEQNKQEELRSDADNTEEENPTIEMSEEEWQQLFTPNNTIDGQEIRFEAVTTRLEAADVHLNSVAKKHKDLVQAVFKECDKDTQELYDCFQPKMEYPKYTSQSRSRYYAVFVCKYLDVYVLRVFSRNDVYKRRKRSGITVMQSDTTEILRVLFVDNTFYHFSKNISYSLGRFNNSEAYPTWHVSDMGRAIYLNEVVKRCDCGYLNDYISEEDINCWQYAKLLFPAFYNNKAEIVFKNKLFLETYRIDNLVDYLEEFSSKQIDFACKNKAINTLPIIKRFGCRDRNILCGLEELMRKRNRYGGSTYQILKNTITHLNFDCSKVDEKLIAFLRKVPWFDAGLYEDYINLLAYQRGVTIEDYFDKNYIERHDIMLRERTVRCDKETSEKYIQAAKELSWIDREENGYFIHVPKNVEEFREEGDTQHICVYSAGYYNKVIRKESIIVFLREMKNVPYVTIEFDYETFEVLQARGKYNRAFEPSLYQYVVGLGRRLCRERLSC